MKYFLCRMIFLAILILPSLAMPESQAMKATLAKLSTTKESFTFVVIGDNRSGDRIYKKIIHKALIRKPLFIVNTGDLIPNHGNREEWKNFWEISKEITVPYFLVPGNHDIDDKESQDVWRDEVDLPGNETYYSFKVGKNLFVILNSCEPENDRRIVGKQFEWLKSVLSGDRYEHKFVFLHYPLFLLKEMNHYNGSIDRYPKLRDELHKLFVDKKVTSVIAGHEHTFNRTEKDGIEYIITGGAGAPLYGKESYNNIMAIKVDGKRLEVKVVDRDGVLRDEFLIR